MGSREGAGRSAHWALVGSFADHGVATDRADAHRRRVDVLAATDGAAGGFVDLLVVLLRREGVADGRRRLLVALHLGDGVVGRVHLVDLKSLAAEGRLEVVGGAADAAEHAEMVARMRALGVGHGGEKARDVGKALFARLGGKRQVLLRRLALARERGLDVLGRHRAELLGLGRGVDETVSHVG
jgi:hypothetical protein